VVKWRLEAGREKESKEEERRAEGKVEALMAVPDCGVGFRSPGDEGRVVETRRGTITGVGKEVQRSEKNYCYYGGAELVENVLCEFDADSNWACIWVR